MSQKQDSINSDIYDYGSMKLVGDEIESFPHISQTNVNSFLGGSSRS